MENKQPTIYDVAELAGVSIATVSRAMSGGSISEASRRKVAEAVEALDYRPAAARHLPDQQGRALALVVSDLNNPYYAALCSGAMEEAAKNGYAIQLYANDLENASSEELVQRVLSHRPRGAVLVGSRVENGAPERILENLHRLQREMPVVAICPRIEGLSCVNIASDPSLSTRKSIAHLVNLGHRRIAFIGGHRDVRFSSARETVYYEEMERRGLPVQQPHAYATGFTPQAGELGVSKMIGNNDPKERPTAIIAINDVVALGVLRQLQRMGIRVPEDMALIGCDNQFFTPYLNPPLTTVDLYPYEHGQSAISELIAALGGGSAFHYSHTRESSLIVRESCGAGLGVRHFD